MRSTNQDILLGGFINAWDSTNTVNIFKCIILIHCLITGWFINACVFFILSISVCLWENKLKRGSGLDLLKTFNNLYKPENKGGGLWLWLCIKVEKRGLSRRL